MSKNNSYVIAGGDSGAQRLRVLGRTMWPTTKAFLERSGLKGGMDCLDVGCGSADVTVKIAEKTGTGSRIVGVDMDAQKLVHAREYAEQNERKIDFQQSRVEEMNFTGEFDLVYCRFVLTHMQDPKKGFEKIVSAAKPGGLVLVEDIDMSVHVNYPFNPSFERYIELYRTAVEKKGADPTIGPKLPNLFMDLGLEEIDLHVTLPTFYQGEEKSIARLTLENIKDVLLEEELSSEEEINKLAHEITLSEENPRTLQSTALIFQVSGRKKP